MPATGAQTWEEWHIGHPMTDEVADHDFELLLRQASDIPDPNNSGENIVVPRRVINLRAKKIITFAEMRTARSTPIEILPAPGASRFYSPYKVTVAKYLSTQGFAFTDSIYVYQDDGANQSDPQFVISAPDFNPVGNTLFDPPKQGGLIYPNAALMFGVMGGLDTVVGEATIIVTVNYTLELISIL